MAIALTGSGGLFTRLGRMGKLIVTSSAAQTGFDDSTDDLFDEYDGADRPLIDNALGMADVLKRNSVVGLQPLFGLAESTLLKMVGDDVPSAGISVQKALEELIRQMRASTDHVKLCTVSASSAAFTGNKGDGTVVVTATRGDGLSQENILAEVGKLTCVTDSFARTATAGVESFNYSGPVRNAGTLDYNFPGYSGANVTIAASSPARQSTLGNQISNGDFEDFSTANVPDDWIVTAGTAGTHIIEDTSVFYSGTSSLKLPGSATLVNISHYPDRAIPLSAYAFHCWVRTSGVPAAGVITIDLYSATEAAVVADDQGVNNSTTISLPGLSGATWTAKNAVFRIPKNPPTDIALRIRMTTALSAGTNCNIDHLCLSPMISPYDGGPGIAIFSGADAFAIGDGWNITTANNQGGATNGATFQTLFDRFFGMRRRRLVLPSNASPTIADTLITS